MFTFIALKIHIFFLHSSQNYTTFASDLKNKQLSPLNTKQNYDN